MLLTDKRGTKQSVKEPTIIIIHNAVFISQQGGKLEKRRNAEKNFHFKITI